jgi:DNA-binding CsgD family transcriptional regulator
MLGFALGWTVSAVWHISENGLAWAQTPRALGVAILLVMLAVAIVVSPPNEDTLIIKEETERLFKSPLLSKDILGGVWKRNCIAIAETHHLTPREREVLFLLAKGRNASIISSDLYISSATAKSHIYHIYQKLNVDSQQELISVVEKNLEALIAQRSSGGSGTKLNRDERL